MRNYNFSMVFQAKKLELADGVLSGAKSQSAKMTFDDLKKIFEIDSMSSQRNNIRPTAMSGPQQ